MGLTKRRCRSRMSWSVDIDMGGAIGATGIVPRHVSRIEKLLYTAGIHTFDDGFFAFGIFAVDKTQKMLLDGDGEDRVL